MVARLTGGKQTNCFTLGRGRMVSQDRHQHRLSICEHEEPEGDLSTGAEGGIASYHHTIRFRRGCTLY
jgi:hypothetical protein